MHNHQLELDLPPGIFYRHGILTTGSEAPTTQKQSVSSMMAWAADDDPDGLATVADIDALLEEDIVEINTKEASEAWKCEYRKAVVERSTSAQQKLYWPIFFMSFAHLYFLSKYFELGFM